MKLSEESLKTWVMTVTSVIVAWYNIEYTFSEYYPITVWEYFQHLIYVTVGAFLGIFILVLLPSGFLVNMLERMIDGKYVPTGQRYTVLSDALVIVSCVTIDVITFLMWISHMDLKLSSFS